MTTMTCMFVDEMAVYVEKGRATSVNGKAITFDGDIKGSIALPSALTSDIGLQANDLLDLEVMRLNNEKKSSHVAFTPFYFHLQMHRKQLQIDAHTRRFQPFI